MTAWMHILSAELAVVWSLSLRLTSFQLPWGHVWPMTDGHSVSLCPARPPSSSSANKLGRWIGAKWTGILKMKHALSALWTPPQLPWVRMTGVKRGEWVIQMEVHWSNSQRFPKHWVSLLVPVISWLWPELGVFMMIGPLHLEIQSSITE